MASPEWFGERWRTPQSSLQRYRNGWHRFQRQCCGARLAPHLPPYPLPLPQKARKGVGRLPLTPFQAPTRGAEEGTQRGQRESMLSIPSRNSCAGTVRAQ